jgi:hypothetical protein
MASDAASAGTLESFRGDYAALAALIAESWAEYDQALVYDEDFLRAALAYPGMSPDLAPTLYVGEAPKGFASAHPRAASLAGRPVRLAISAILSVAPDYKGLAGGLLLRDLARRVRTAGFDGLLHYCIDGDPMDAMLLGLCRAMRLPTGKIFTVGYLSRLLFPKAPSDTPADPATAKALMDLSVGVDAPLRRLWTAQEADWQCFGRAGAVAVLHEAGGRCGVASGYVQQVAGRGPACLFIDALHWGDLDADERAALIKRFLDAGAGKGARIAVAPRLGYFDETPLTAAQFRPSQRIIHAYVSLWNGELPEGEFASLYMDVF